MGVLCPNQAVYPIDRLVNVAEYHVENFGCRASRADGEAIAAGLRMAGLSEAQETASANVVIVNTCSVTAEAEREARGYLRRVRRSNPEARIVFTGCYAQRAPEEVAALDGVSAVVGNSHKSQVVEAATTARASLGGRIVVRSADALVPVHSLLASAAGVSLGGVSIWHDPLFAHSELAALPFAADAGQTRPNLKIQDGCGNRCSFCIIPVTRGPSRSVSIEESLRSVEEFVAAGGKELVLSGINLGRWGRDLSPAGRFEALVAAILERTALPRLRISSVEPMDWSQELIELFRRYGRDGGGDAPVDDVSVLHQVVDRYFITSVGDQAAEAIRAALPEAAIGADVMVGFPGETEALFRETYDFIARLPLTYLHVFPFSARPGTAAFRLHESFPVHGEAVKERKAALRALIAAKNEAFRRRSLGSELSVVTLSGGGERCTEALSDNFARVSVFGIFPPNRMLRVRIEGLVSQGSPAEGLFGTAISAS